MKEIKIKVPATAANLGPGFDCIGMALDLFDEIVVKLAEKPSEEKINLINQAIASLFRKVGSEPPSLSISSTNNIPPARGLGRSAAEIAAGLLIANLLLNQPFSKKELAIIGSEIEGHPDNIFPAIFGGCQLVIKEDGEFINFPIPIPKDLKVILFIPDFPMPTWESRAILPKHVLRDDAVYNMGRVALLIASFFSGELGLLYYGTRDRLHQQARKKLFPAMDAFFDAALKAGALGVCLCGGGSSILAFATDREDKIASSLMGAGFKEGVKGKVIITCPTQMGAYII